jgi:hypothetical protein
VSNKKETLSTMRKLLIKCFVILDLDETTTMGIMSMLETEEQEYKMLEFLKENPKATEQQILKKLKEL